MASAICRDSFSLLRTFWKSSSSNSPDSVSIGTSRSAVSSSPSGAKATVDKVAKKKLKQKARHTKKQAQKKQAVKNAPVDSEKTGKNASADAMEKLNISLEEVIAKDKGDPRQYDDSIPDWQPTAGHE